MIAITIIYISLIFQLLPADTQPQLVKYLLKSLGTDICNEITLYVANECNLNIKNSSNLTVEQRNKIAQECGMFI